MALVNKVLVIGGGVGGMCAAIQLRKQGVERALVMRLREEVRHRFGHDAAHAFDGDQLRAPLAPFARVTRDLAQPVE